MDESMENDDRVRPAEESAAGRTEPDGPVARTDTSARAGATPDPDKPEPAPEPPARGRTPAGAPDEDGEGYLPRPEAGKYTAPGSAPAHDEKPSVGGHLQRGETVALMLLAGIAVGAGIGWGIDRLAGTFPGFMIFGVFAGFGLALYAVYIETR